MLVLHIFAGGIAILAAVLALSAVKGAVLHRKAGNVFFVTMLVAALSSVYLSYRINELPLMGVFAAYLLVTSWLIIRHAPGTTSLFDWLALLLISFVATGLFVHAYQIANKLIPDNHGVPPQAFVGFGILATLCALLDVNMLVRKGLHGKHRIVRHLWRMLVAMIFAMIALLSQKDLYPAWMIESKMILLPLFLLFVVLAFWLVRVLFTSKYAVC